MAGQPSVVLTDLLTRSCETGETLRSTGDGHGGHKQISETWRFPGDGGDGRRSAHNPEVAGSNPAPATRSEAPSDHGRGLLHVICARENVHKPGLSHPIGWLWLRQAVLAWDCAGLERCSRRYRWVPGPEAASGLGHHQRGLASAERQLLAHARGMLSLAQASPGRGLREPERGPSKTTEKCSIPEVPAP